MTQSDPQKDLAALVGDYPDRYEISTTTKRGLQILIRPMCRDDGPLLKGLFETLSPESIYFRFFSPLRTLSEEMLAQLTHIDHNRDVVLVAIQKTGSEEKILGVFRLMCNLNEKKGELAIVVGDPWQGKGVAAKLFRHGLFIAKLRGIDSVYGMVLVENRTVLDLARRLGFIVEWDSDAHAHQLKMDLKFSGKKMDGERIQIS
ncbi:MAG: GNAT family N-acetyltransferase [Deltaproteobacteria bacterium]|nr:GNAT family N-acetyltransferase [Deltaproteobacteria bacterium]